MNIKLVKQPLNNKNNETKQNKTTMWKKCIIFVV